MIKPIDFLVRVSCMTYNHANYIIDAMKGFVMQQTSFPFVCTIVDDASTDGEQEVVKKFLQEYFPVQNTPVSYEKDMDYGYVAFSRHKTNENCYFAVVCLKENHLSQRKSKVPYLQEWMDTKYIAMCEGDDYWTDPLKLQSQIDYLEKHKEVGVCYTDYSRLEESKHIITHSLFELQRQYRPESYEQHLYRPGYLAPMTWVYRKELLDLLDKRGGFVDGTYMMMLEWLYHSKVGYLPIDTAVYRSHQGSASSPKGAKKLFDYYKGVFDTQMYYANKYSCSEELIERIKTRGYLDMLPIAVFAENDEFVKEVQTYFEAVGYDAGLIIRNLKEGKRVRESYAYKIGKFLVSPFSRIRKKCKSDC